MNIKREKIREKLQDLTLFDDELMTLAFHEDCELTEFLLHAICPQAGFKVTKVCTQQNLPNIMGRSLKLDILAQDILGRTVNIEVQQLPKGASPLRARFHASLLDVHLLEKGQNFDDLPTTYIIFITKTDVLGGGLPVYTVDRQIHELQKPFDDKTVILYVNGACMDDTQLGKIMHDFQCASPDDMKCQTFADKLKNIKRCEEDRFMGALFDSIYEDGREEGREEAREEVRKNCANMIYKHMLKFQCALNEALEWFEVSEEDREKVIALVHARFEKLKNSAQEASGKDDSEKRYGQALTITKYIQKTGCTIADALDFFEISESERKLLLGLL